MIIKTKFDGLILVKNKKFNDTRGYFKELIVEKNIKLKFPFHVMSFSKKNIIRGLHIQTKNPQGKFITVIKGKVFDVTVDLRKKSRTYGKYFSKILSAKNSLSIYIPPGFAHGFSVLSASADVMYKCDALYNKQSESGLIFNDPTLKIDWKLSPEEMIVSEKDLVLPTFDNIDANF